tara:strand:+ start:28 stop:450 length:423 start_codon:yes stop_codon:yes gene_type:complete
MLFSVFEGFFSVLFFLMPKYWLGTWLGYEGQTFRADLGMFRVLALILFTRAGIYFYGGRCISNTTAQGSVVQRLIVGGGIFLLCVAGSLPTGMALIGGFNLLGAGYTFLAVKRYQSEIRGEEDFSILEEMKWAFMTPSEE